MEKWNLITEEKNWMEDAPCSHSDINLLKIK